MSKIFLYILGAGASCNAIPLVKDFAHDLIEFSRTLQSLNFSDGSTLWGIERQDLADAMRWLGEEARHHASVDTFAKKLFFLQDYENLRKLKAVLSTYLSMKQAVCNVDFRYDSFLASVLENDKDGKICLPDRLRILTWNYDIQLERAFYGFCNNDDHVAKYISLNDSKVYRINGRCATDPPGHIHSDFFPSYGSSDPKPWADGIRLYNSFMKPTNPEPEIRFAWENDVRTRFERLNLNLDRTTVTIVVIGYSFPYFNREIDDIVFKQFYDVDTVYMQYPDGEHAAIEQRLKKFIPPETKLVRIDSKDLFYIPDDSVKRQGDYEAQVD